MSNVPSATSRIRGAVLGLAVCDALGAPVEFKRRGAFPFVNEMLPNSNFGTPAGAFTDDTSMALCLAQSLIENEAKHNDVDQVEKYLMWRSKGYMSSVGRCFDIGVSTDSCLTRWKILLRKNRDSIRPGSPASEAAYFGIRNEIRSEFNKDNFCGNGSLMRLISVPLIAPTAAQAVDLAVQSSMTTHPNPRCSNACAVYTKLVRLILDAGDQLPELTSLATSFAEMLDDPLLSTDSVFKVHFKPYTSLLSWQNKPESRISSTGYVLHSLEAALWSFFTTTSFEEGATKAVNLGNDSDTIGAIYGGLAGAYYGSAAIPQRWLAKMKRMDLLEDVIVKILKQRDIAEQGAS